MTLRIDTDVEMTTRDGIVLRADVYRPDDDAAYPALLHRTPYDKANPALTSVLVADPVALARAGYAVVVQDVRGRFASDGVLDFGEQEHDDGYDAVEWAAAQPWCDGNVGIYGSSYHAITAYAALSAAPPHLRAVVAMIGAADLATTVRPGGLFELGFLTYYSLGQVLEQIRRSGRPDAPELAGRVLAALGRLGSEVHTHPLTDVDVLSDPGLAPWWHTWLADPDGEYVTRSPARDHDLPDIPLLSVVGAMDFMQESMLTLFERRSASERHRLVLGPWAHNGTYTGAVGARTYAAAPGGVAAWQPVIQGWFDRWLKNEERVAMPLARALLGGEPVSYFVTGPRPSWQQATSWPPQIDEQVWHLQPDGVLDQDQARSGVTGYEHDPHRPVPTCGGPFTAPLLGPDGVQDQREREAHPGVVSWTSAPLAEPITVTGAARLELDVGSTGASTDVVVTLGDVEPDGFVANVAEGALRTGPGRIAVALHHTAHTFGTGHRLRVDVAGSSSPRFSVNPGTGSSAELSSAEAFEDAVPTEQTVTDARLVLPACGSTPG